MATNDPLSRVPNIWRPCLAVELNGAPGRLLKMNPGPGLNWFADVGPGYQSGVDRILAEAWGRGQLQPKILLNDPTGATTGCLAAFCRGLWKLPDLYCRPLLPGGWVVGRPFTRPGIVFDGVHGPTEAAAWRNAILAHPSLSELR